MWAKLISGLFIAVKMEEEERFVSGTMVGIGVKLKAS